MSVPQQPTPDVVTSTPDPSVQTLVFTALRAAMMIAGPIGLSTPAWANNPSTLWAIAGGVATIIGVGWSFYEKWQAARAAHASAVVSAQRGAPLKAV